MKGGRKGGEIGRRRNEGITDGKWGSRKDKAKRKETGTAGTYT